MTQDAFEQLQAANPLPEDPAPLPMTPLLNLVDEVLSHGADARSSQTTSVRATTSRGRRTDAGKDDGEPDSH
jgi:hypothetical protein